MKLKAKHREKKNITRYYVWYQLRLKLDTLNSEEMQDKIVELMEKYGKDVWSEVVITSATAVDYEVDKDE